MFGSKLITTPLRKATKAVVYTAVPVAGPLKAVAVGTRGGNLNRKEQRKQTKLMEQHNALLAQQNALLAHQALVSTQQTTGAPMSTVLRTPDGQWASYDGGVTYQAGGMAPPTWWSGPAEAIASPSIADEIQTLARLRDDGVLSRDEFESAKARLLRD